MKSLLVINVVAFEDSILLNVDTNVPAYKANPESGAYEQTEDTSFSMVVITPQNGVFNNT